MMISNLNMQCISAEQEFCCQEAKLQKFNTHGIIVYPRACMYRQRPSCERITLFHVKSMLFLLCLSSCVAIMLECDEVRDERAEWMVDKLGLE